MSLQDNPLEELESMILSTGSMFHELGYKVELSPDELQAAKEQYEAAPHENNGQLDGVDSEELELREKNQTVALYKKVCKEATLAIERKMLNLSEREQENLVKSLLDSLSYLINEVNNGSLNQTQVKSLVIVKEFILNRYKYKEFLDISDKSDGRLKLNIDAHEIKLYFKKLSDLGVISDDDLELFLHSNFYGFKPKMKIKEKIVVNTTQANIRYFMFNFRGDKKLYNIDRAKFIKILHESFTCFDRTEEQTTYKKLSVEPAKYNLY